MFSSEKNPLNAREKLVMDLINAASAGNWDSVDSLAPLVAGMNGQEMLGFLLSQTRSEDDNVRDGAMTGWFYRVILNFSHQI
jgi:hypothetical protein